MANLVDLEKEYLLPCKHCAEPMQAWELFCPFCGQDQTAAQTRRETTSHAALEQPASNADEALGPIAAHPEAVPQREPWEPVVQPITTGSANDEGNTEIGLVRPGVTWLAEAAAGGGPELAAGNRSATRSRWLIGALLTLVVLLSLVVVRDHFYVDRQAPAGKSQQVRANVQQMPTAPSQEQARGADEPPVAPARAPAPPQAPTPAIAAPDDAGVTGSGAKGCDPALAALALCSKP